MKKKILIIEDDKDVRDNIITLLSEEGYNALSAKDGKDGIKTAKEESPDLIICDIMMYGINGYEVLDELSKNKLTEAIPFIFLTARADIESIRLGMQLGADDYLLKPFLADELLKSIETRLRKVETYKAGHNISTENSKSEKYSIEDKIFIRSDGNPVLIKINEILFINAENQYTSIRMLNSKAYLVRRSLLIGKDLCHKRIFSEFTEVQLLTWTIWLRSKNGTIQVF